MDSKWMLKGVLGLSLALGGGAAMAAGGPPAKLPAELAAMRHAGASKVTVPYYTAKIPGGGTYQHIDRAKLSSTLAEREAQIAKYLEHEIVHMGDVPQFEILPLNVGLADLKMTKEFLYEHQAAEFEISRAKLAGNKLKLRVLCPVNGHCGIDNTIDWASRTEEAYNLTWNGKALPKFAPAGKLVKVHDVEVELEPGQNTLHFWADGSAGVAGSPAERTIHIHLK